MNNIISVPKILLPSCSPETWAVVACDQFTSQPDYWEQLDREVGNAPSALRIIYPEIYLERDTVSRIEKINATMTDYLQQGLFVEYDGFVLIERTFESGVKRVGLLVAVDLEEYNWERVRVPIRATEDTIKDRLPVRVEIRKDATLEVPHILLLIDDKEKTVIEPLFEACAALPKLYDFHLNMGGGKLAGYFVENTRAVQEKLYALLDENLQKSKYGYDAGVLFAVGDGNHSLATAKVHWDNVKKELKQDELATHPARYALVEVVNIYGEGMDFEPIHRVLFGLPKEELKKLIKNAVSFPEDGFLETENDIFVYTSKVSGAMQIRRIQEVVERLVDEGVTVDYVHGIEHLKSTVGRTGGVGISMPSFPQGELFDYVLNVGNLPKKAFSIGEAEEKKYYMECRKIK